MRAILSICREHNQPPSWWDDIAPGDQALLLADLQLRTTEAARG